ncbi:hypothetical protein [Sulfuriferula thiophila]|uniref:hypothetical protein n=1 Tax=Sulfuriferula thiophila TaxID=1781211 RepID=UPI000F60DA4B|nr:hypothetical protein [Sulfuriferula thiophila]
MKKVLITIQGKTLILQYHVKSGLMRKGVGWMPYIEVQSSWELTRFNLRGLTPEMFCVNISDMVNVRGLLSGVVENERQLPVARWEINQDDYRSALKVTLSHAQIVELLAALPGYVEEVDDEFVEFEAQVIADAAGDGTASGYRLTIVTQDIGDKIAPYAYYNLDTYSADSWQGYPPPAAQHELIRNALASQLQAISDAGVQLTQVYDATDYAIAS